MKKIINGKKYDTETAVLVCVWDNGHYCNDFNYTSEELYRKRTGEFFVFGEGGARSKYAKRYGNSSAWGCQIVPVNEDYAKEFVEKYGTVEKYEELFGGVEE